MHRSEPSAAPTPSGPGTTGFDVRLANSPFAAREGRQEVYRHLGDLLDDHALDDVLLVVSELVTNVVRRGRGDIRLRLAFDGALVSGTVEDAGDGFARAAPGGLPPATGGRGLDIVGKVAGRWGLHPETSAVWFEMPTGTRLPEAT